MTLVFRMSHDKYGNGLTIRYLQEACRRRGARATTASIFCGGIPWGRGLCTAHGHRPI